MLRIHQIKLRVEQPKSDLQFKIMQKLQLKTASFSYQIVKESIDARKDELFFSYVVDIEIENENKYLKIKDVSIAPIDVYQQLTCSTKRKVIVIGCGPAGLFAAMSLVRGGCEVLLYERGQAVDERVKDVEAFWKNNQLNPESNVQFGEGGAGTFSDGKLTSRSKDIRSLKVLEELVRHGAHPEILYQAYPHIGTDQLRAVVKHMRNEIIELGGNIHFNSKVEDFRVVNQQLSAVYVNGEWIEADAFVLAIGHSARDTFMKLNEHCIAMQPKPFAVGVRVEHPQSMINDNQYGAYAHCMPPANYKLTHTCLDGKGVYSFCMCPGGVVVNASSEQHQLVCNGMSNHARDEANANSAILVQVDPSDVGEELFDGVKFQIELEKRAYELGKDNKAPAQNIEDYLNHVPSTSLNIASSFTNGVRAVDMHSLFPDFINRDLEEGFVAFNHRLKGFNGGIMVGVESRSTSPIKINREFETGQSINTENLYPCGEGAGYAGGIVSAAIDGLRVAELIIRRK